MTECEQGHSDPPERAYLSGPMAGYPDRNYPAFTAMREHLRRQGWVVICPAEHSVEVGAPEKCEAHEAKDTPEQYAEYMRWDIGVLIDPTTTAIVLLPGWKESRGARIELAVAVAMSLNIYVSTPWGLTGVKPGHELLHHKAVA